jgi:5'-nucleotidase
MLSPIPTQSSRPLILVSNDDGYHSPGIRSLRDALQDFGDVVLVAPEFEQSAMSHAITLNRSLRLKSTEANIYALDGTPADCVYVALYSDGRILPRKPDLVVSGINRGLNLGQDAFYSGTVAAAREAALRGIPAIAVSADAHADLAIASALACSIAKRFLGHARASTAAPPLLNVNIPKDWNGELKTARLGKRLYDEAVFYRTDPRGREYLWLGGPKVEHREDPGSDTHAFDQGYATLTSLSLDLSEPNDGGLAALCVIDR